MSARFEQALAWQQRGDLAQADAACAELLQMQPDHADAWHLRALLAAKATQSERAIEYFRRSLALNTLQPAVHSNLGIALMQARRMTEALAHFDRALALQYRSAATLYGRGTALLALERSEEALADFELALDQAPELVPALTARGHALQDLGRLNEALWSVEFALQLAPDEQDALLNRGDILGDLKRHEEALESYEQALRAGPASIEIFNNRGNTLRALGMHEAALSSYERALALDPARPETLSNRGNVLLHLNRFGEALQCYEAALRIRPEFADALDNLGQALLVVDRHAEAVKCYERLMQIAPEYKMVRSNLFNARNHCCDWTDYERQCTELLASVQQGELVIPGAFMIGCDSAAHLQRCTQRFVEDRWCMQRAPLWSGQCHRHECLRVAYVSGDFRQHAVSVVMAGVWEQHRQGSIETIGISLQPRDASGIAERVRAAFGGFYEVARYSDREIAELLRRLEADVVVDLAGLTRHGRPGIFAHRSAPVQVGYLGYPGTMGTRVMDYIIADEVVIAAGEECWYSEQVVRLPHCYLPTDNERPIAPMPSRDEAGLPEQGLVFCAFTNAYKINPPLFEIWMLLLREVEGSVLWLRSMGPEARANLAMEAGKRGVNPERLIYGAHVPSMADHLARQQLADLYLDTQPYNAHSTACDALWAGVPVLTCAGRSFASRVAASALRAVGLPQLITHSLHDYESRALELARHPEQLRALRAQLAQQRASAPLFDTARYTRDLEHAFHRMHQLAAAGQAPAGFRVSPA